MWVSALAVVVLVAVVAALMASRGLGPSRKAASQSAAGNVTASSEPTVSESPVAVPSVQPGSFQVAPGSDVLVLGDSLAVGTYPYLGSMLPDRRLRYEAQVGINTDQARSALKRLLQKNLVPPVVVVSAGTNDSALNPSAWRAEVEQILRMLGPNRCVVWSNIVRPKSSSGGPGPLNAVLTSVVGQYENLDVVDWAAMAAAHPRWLVHDGIHPDEQGMRARAEGLAEGVLQCSPYDPEKPRPNALPKPVFRLGTSTGSTASPSPAVSRSGKPSSSASVSPSSAKTASSTASERPSSEPTSSSTVPADGGASGPGEPAPQAAGPTG